jgi:hypothetical protein
MIYRFAKITDGLYRGSAPNDYDVTMLHNKYGINKIVSLDQESSNKIDYICDLLKINHVLVPIDFSKSSLINLLKYDLKNLLINNGPTYLHCFAGKDRTGLVSALFKCKYMGEDPSTAIDEAKSMGFGLGIPPEITLLYEKMIKSCKPSEDINNADIVSNERLYSGDSLDSYLSESGRVSFAPWQDPTRVYPYDATYNYVIDQYPTRENYISDKAIKEHNDEQKVTVPAVGIFNTDSSAKGAGFAENFGGFTND